MNLLGLGETFAAVHWKLVWQPPLAVPLDRGGAYGGHGWMPSGTKEWGTRVVFCIAIVAAGGGTCSPLPCLLVFGWWPKWWQLPSSSKLLCAVCGKGWLLVLLSHYSVTVRGNGVWSDSWSFLPIPQHAEDNPACESWPLKSRRSKKCIAMKHVW